MYRVDASGRAEKDLDKIIEYIIVKLSAPQAASDLLDKIYACYDSLEKNPYIYEECRDLRLKSEGYRRAVINNYILVYKIYENTKQVVAHGFFYGGQNYTTLI
ncbi:MAG: type II toxin-antitoxin system RelE/ParE family toxin [Oscillospiraceae bacterium]|nr:type II toxin-antitoxin system RelE/ParE family toxin [Oscillospiraceae bacterium]